MIKKAIILTQMMMLLVVWPSTLLAEEADKAKDVQFTYGNVVEVLQDKIIINEYDYLTDEEQEVEYFIDEFSYLENIESLEELIIGDEIEITYNETNNQRIAVSISKASNEEIEDDLDEFTLEYEMENEEGDNDYETRG